MEAKVLTGMFFLPQCLSLMFFFIIIIDIFNWNRMLIKERPLMMERYCSQIIEFPAQWRACLRTSWDKWTLGLVLPTLCSPTTDCVMCTGQQKPIGRLPCGLTVQSFISWCPSAGVYPCSSGLRWRPDQIKTGFELFSITEHWSSSSGSTSQMTWSTFSSTVFPQALSHAPDVSGPISTPSSPWALISEGWLLIKHFPDDLSCDGQRSDQCGLVWSIEEFKPVIGLPAFWHQDGLS